ncbi:UPF0323 family lipoprotein [Campylobacter rectus]|uniref:UPF0323 family lipoprotein n=1 Tax=Campylobacter rectus TaxID=203 RepID=UPI0023F55BCD|nr:UPF0323 family lipoprotein [Campylobacter rectus]
MRVFKGIKKVASYAAVGGFGAVVIAGLAGCGSDNGGANDNDGSALNEAAQKTGAFVIIEETAPGKYKVLEEYPSSETRVVLKDINGTERVLSKEEMDRLIAEENAKIDAGTSNLTNQNAQLSSGGMSIGEALLASAAGAIIGSWIGNKLFNNPGYQSQRQSAYKNPSAYSRSVDSFNKAKATSSAGKPSGGKSGFFGGSSSKSGSNSNFGG